MNAYDIVLAGIGGQGILLAAEVIGTAAVQEGHDVRVSELHGMAQRGGAVVSHVRVGDKVFSPTVMEGSAHVIVGFEPMEALRNIKFANPKTSILLSNKAVKTSGGEHLAPEEIIERLRKFTERIVIIDSSALAADAGAAIAQNAVMIGALAAIDGLPIGTATLREALIHSVPAKYLAINSKAFDLGYQASKTAARLAEAEATRERS